MRKRGVVRTTDAEQFKTSREKTDEENLRLAEARAKTSSRFIQHFSKSLSAEQMTSAGRLLWALHVFETAGNATAAYDGVSIQNTHAGPKDGVTGKVVDAGKIIHCAQKTLVSASSEWPLYHCLAMALVSDWPPVKVGELAQGFKRRHWKERRRREIGGIIIDQATAALVIPFRQFGKKGL